ncbi:MAG: alpha/beta hydrolase [Pseudobdellovibrionaceae bacterium]
MIKCLLTSSAMIICIAESSLARLDASFTERSQSISSPSSAIALFEEYQKEYQGAFKLIHSRSRPATRSVLLIHPYTRGPYTMEEIGHLLYKQGYNVIAIQLEGHGNRNQSHNLANVSLEDWIADAKFGWALTRAVGMESIVVGYSLGGLLGLYLAKTHQQEVKAFVGIAPMVGVNISGARLSCVGRQIMKLAPSFVTYYQREFIAGACAIRDLLDVVIPPISQAKSQQARKDFHYHMRDVFSEIKTPTLIAFSDIDQIVSLNQGTRPMLAYLGTKPMVLEYKASDHVDHLTIIENHKNYEGRDLLGEISTFLKSL